MRYVNYPALLNQMKFQAPYRGTLNRYPLGDRKQSKKYFFHEKDADGNDLMRIIYGKRWVTEPSSKEEYDLMGEDSIYKSTDSVTGEVSYYKYNVLPNEIGIVRADNSFEFTGQSYYQGTMGILSTFASKGYFYRSSKHGGMLYRGIPRYDANETMIPIFKGLRVDCDTMMPDPKHTYKVVGTRVSRKNSKELIKRYEEFFSVAEAMMKAMPVRNFVDIAYEYINENSLWTGDGKAYWAYRANWEQIKDDAIEIMNSNPIDAAALFCAGLGERGIENFRWLLARLKDHGDIHEYGEQTAEEYFSPMQKAVRLMLYRSNPEVFKDVEFEFGKKYPASMWGYSILVDGQEVRQY